MADRDDGGTDDLSPEARLGAALRKAREERNVSLRSLARRLRRAHSGLVEYERGHRLAPPDVVEAYETELGLRTRSLTDIYEKARLEIYGRDRAHRQTYVLRVAGDPTEAPSQPAGPETDGWFHDGACPYKGLEAFGEEDAAVYVGREDDVDKVVEKLDDARFVAIFGPSGSGKSSLVRAGVVPAIKRGAIGGSERWTVQILTPRSRPLTELAARLGRLHESPSMQSTLKELRKDERTVDLVASLAMADRSADERLVIVVDQLEEIFTLCKDEGERQAFLRNLCHAATVTDGRVSVVVALRADFYARCAEERRFAALVSSHQHLITPLGPTDLRRVIEVPAERAGLELEDGLVDTIMRDIAERPGTLPLLQYALLEVWSARTGRTMTLRSYAERGRVEGALAQRADSLYQAFPPARQAVARRLFLRLTQPGQGTEDTRRQATITELVTAETVRGEVEEVAKALADHRLVTIGVDSMTGERVIEVAHEALIQHWPALRAWVDEDRAALLALRRLTEASSEWARSGRDAGLLYRNPRLAEWHDRSLDDLNELERQFLVASRKRDEHDRGARSRRIRIGGLGLVIAILVVSVLAYTANTERRRALSREVAASARLELSNDPELAVLLAREALHIAETSQAEAVLRQAVLESRIRTRFDAGQGIVWAVAASPTGDRIASGGVDGIVHVWDPAAPGRSEALEGHSGDVNAVAFSPDGERVASAGDDATVRVWDLSGRREPLVLTGPVGRVNAVAFSPDGRGVAGAGADGIVRIWPLAGPATQPQALVGHEGPVYSVSYGADGGRLATGGKDGTVRVWNLAGPPGPIVLRGHDGTVFGVALSPDGTRTASAGEDGTVRVWRLGDGRGPVVLRGHNGPVLGIAFAADGRQVASAGNDKTVRLWNLATEDTLVFRGHSGAVNAVAMGPRIVVSAGNDGSVRVWDAARDEDPVALLGHQGTVHGVALSPDGGRVASSGEDGTVRIWDIASPAEPTVLCGHQGAVYGVADSPDGRRVASSGEDGTVRIWDLTGPAEPTVLRGHEGAVYGVAYSADGRRVASSGEDGTVRIWDLTGSSDPTVLRGHQGSIVGVAFSSDGSRVGSAGDDGTVRIWRLGHAGEPLVLQGHEGPVFDVAFSPDGKFVGSAGEDGTVRIWRYPGGQVAAVLHGHEGAADAVAFRPGSSQLASSGADGSVRIWHAVSGAEPLVLGAHRGPGGRLSFSRDGSVLASAGADGIVRVWRCAACGSVSQVRSLADERVTRSLTSEERSDFLHR